MLDPIEEAKWEMYRKYCRELKIPTVPQSFIVVEKYNKNMDLLYRDTERGHSWTRNFYNLMFAMLTDARTSGTNNFAEGYMSAKNSAGSVTYNVDYHVQRTTYFVPGGGIVSNILASTYGIIVGTNAAAFSAEQYALQTVIAHGVATGNLYYHIMSGSDISYDAGTDTWTSKLNRFFENNSGGSITVAETGLYWYGYFFGTSQSYYMIERNVLGSSVAVANGEILKMTYLLTMDFSAIDA
jgi:hypothetical protein